jgi:hypothetical protein
MRDTVLVQTLVDVQQVPPQPWIGLNGGANKDIRPAVIVDIYHRYPTTPFPIASNPCYVGDIFENKIPLIQVKPVGYGIAGEIDIWKAILIKIANAYTATIVYIDQVKRVDTVIFYNLIIKVNAGMVGRNKLKSGFAFAGD